MQDDDIVRRRLFRRDAKNDLALVGELDGVPEQIDQNLTQASWVGSDRIGHTRLDVHDQFEALLVRPQRHGTAPRRQRHREG
jgi:hypothetical protein